MPPPCVLGEANVGLKLSSLNMIECCLKRFLLRCSKPFLTAIIPNAQWCFIWFDNNMRLNVCTFLWIYKTENGYNLLFPNEALVMVWPATKQVEFSFPFYCISSEFRLYNRFELLYTQMTTQTSRRNWQQNAFFYFCTFFTLQRYKH